MPTTDPRAARVIVIAADDHDAEPLADGRDDVLVVTPRTTARLRGRPVEDHARVLVTSPAWGLAVSTRAVLLVEVCAALGPGIAPHAEALLAGWSAPRRHELEPTS